MININLTPKSELENPLWFVPDALLLALVCIIGMFGVDLYLDTERQQIDIVVAEQSVVQRESAQFAPFVEQLKRLEGQIKDVNQRLSALNGVSGEIVQKYAPIIAVEHIQKLKPQGVWLTAFEVKDKPASTPGAAQGRGVVKTGSNFGSGSIVVRGLAIDNLLVAEFMASLRSTKTQSVEAGDMRTQIFFDDIVLPSTRLIPLANDLNLNIPVPGQPAKQIQIITFELSMNFDSNPVKGARTVASFKDFYPVNTKFDVAAR